MRLYMIRRTRGFIKTNYAEEDENRRKYLLFQNGENHTSPSEYQEQSSSS